MNDKSGMTVLVKTISRLTFSLIIVFGLYIVLHGHLTPGGGFAGGVIIALSFISIMLAFGKDVALKKLSQPVVSFLESLGALLFILIAFFGFIGGYFLINFIKKGEAFALFSAGTIPLYNIIICLKVGAGLFSVFVVLVLLKSLDKK